MGEGKGRCVCILHGSNVFEGSLHEGIVGVDALGDFSIRRITHDMCAYDSPYNTYRVAGLPPGPIRLPEKATIDQILDSKPHDYIFMCAKSDFSGYHDFATDLGSHNANAQRYQTELNKRNIK